MIRSGSRLKFAVALSAAGVLGFSQWKFIEHRKSMRPIVAGDAANQLRLTELASKLANARKATDEKPDIERQTVSAREELLRWSDGKVPVGPSKVWFPVWLRQQLENSGIRESQIRLNSEIPEPGASGFKRSFWNVNLPAQAGLRDIPKVLLALQEIEQRQHLIKILDCNFQSGPDGNQPLTGTFNVEAIVEE